MSDQINSHICLMLSVYKFWSNCQIWSPKKPYITRVKWAWN